MADFAAVQNVSLWFEQRCGFVRTGKTGCLAKAVPKLDDIRCEDGGFLQALEERSEVQRVWTNEN